MFSPVQTVYLFSLLLSFLPPPLSVFWWWRGERGQLWPGLFSLPSASSCSAPSLSVSQSPLCVAVCVCVCQNGESDIKKVTINHFWLRLQKLNVAEWSRTQKQINSILDTSHDNVLIVTCRAFLKVCHCTIHTFILQCTKYAGNMLLKLFNISSNSLYLSNYLNTV